MEDVSGITRQGLVRCLTTVELVSPLEQGKAAGRRASFALSRRRVDWVILDELGCLQFSQAVGALLFRWLGMRDELTRHDHHPPDCGGKGQCLRQYQAEHRLLERLTRHGPIVENRP